MGRLIRDARVRGIRVYKGIAGVEVHNLGETIERGLFGVSADHRGVTHVSQLNASRPIIKVCIILC